MVFWRTKAYDELPALAIRRGELRKSLRLVTAGWMFGIVWMTAIGGSRMNYLGRMVGFGDMHFGLVQALPFFATFIQLFATLLIERTGLRKYQFITCGTIHRFLWIVVGLLPLVLPIPSSIAVWTMLATIMTSWAVEALARPAWWNWMGDLIPKRIRGRYFAMRGLMTRMIQIPTVLLLAIYASWAIDPAKPMTAADQPVLLYSLSIMFAVAGVFGMIDILVFYRIREVLPTRADGPRIPAVQITIPEDNRRKLTLPLVYGRAMLKQFVSEPLQNHAFRRYVLYGITITFASVVSAQFFYRHLLECVGLGPVGTDLLFMVIGPLVSMLSARFWGRLIDSWGRRPVLTLATLFTVFSVWPYFFASPYTPNPQWLVAALNAAIGWVGGLFGQSWGGLLTGYPLGAWLIMTLSVIIGGAGWMGILLAQNTIMLSFADGPGRSRYIAATGLLFSVGGLLGWIGGPVAAGLSFLAYDASPIRIGWLLWNNWHAVFLLSFLGRLLALLLLRHMPDPGARQTSQMVRAIGANVYHGVYTKVLLPLRSLRWRVVRRRPDSAADTEGGSDGDQHRGAA